MDLKADNDVRLLIRSLESSKSLRGTLLRANFRLVVKFLRVVSVAAGDAAYVSSVRLFNDTRKRRNRGKRPLGPKKSRRHSRVTGVYYLRDRGKWAARVQNGPLRKFLGSFPKEEQAINAVRRFRRKNVGTSTRQSRSR